MDQTTTDAKAPGATVRTFPGQVIAQMLEQQRNDALGREASALAKVAVATDGRRAGRTGTTL